MNEMNELITHLRREAFRKDGKNCSLICCYSSICFLLCSKGYGIPLAYLKGNKDTSGTFFPALQ